MLQRLNQLPLTAQAVAVLLLPFLGLAWFTHHDMQFANSLARASVDQQAFVELGAEVGALLHETQKERGLSSGVLSSGGRNFVSELAVQRRERDQRAADLTKLLTTIDLDTLPERFQRRMTAAVDADQVIRQERVKVDALSTSPRDSLLAYSSATERYLSVLSAVPLLSDTGRMASLGTAYASLAQAKELAGLERSALSVAFTRGSFAPGEADEFKSLIAAQESYIDGARRSVNAEENALIDQALADPAIAEAQRFRDLALAGATSGQLNADSAQWFAAQSAKLNVLKSVEDQLLEHVAQLAVDGAAAARGAQIRAFTVGFIAMATVGLATLFFVLRFRRLSRDLGARVEFLDEALSRLSNGDFSMDLTTEEPATGVLAATQSMQSVMRERAHAEQQQLAESNRIRVALDGMERLVLIADDASRIVFANRAAQHVLGDAVIGRGGDQAPTVTDLLNRFGIDSAQQAAMNAGEAIDAVVSGRSLSLAASPVNGEQGERVGTVMIWTDRTSEVSIETEVQSVVHAARCGDLTQRVDLSGKTGFLAALSDSMNELLAVSELITSDTMRVLGAVASGNLRETIDREYEGSFERLKQDANATVAKLTEVVGAIQLNANSVKGGAEEIAQGNNNLRVRTEEQAASLEKAASSMESLTETVNKNAHSAAEADEVAKTARRKAERGGEVVRSAVQAMQEINESSQRISDIIGVIDEIAFQTNLLALNAAVEAARAGEQGRGFAVVANEVRSLAGRSASAAKEIKDLIEDSGKKVVEGSRLVDESGQTLEDIVQEVNRLTVTVGEIAAASQAQSSGINQVNKTVTQIDAFTQQNAALVQQAAAASDLLGSQSRELDELIAFFSVADATNDNAFDHSYTGPERRSASRPWAEQSSEAAADVPSEPEQEPEYGNERWAEF